MDLESFKNSIADKGFKTAPIVYFTGYAVLPIESGKDLKPLCTLIYDFEEQSKNKIQILVKPQEDALKKLEENKAFMHDFEYISEKTLIEEENKVFQDLSNKLGSDKWILLKILTR